MPNKFIIEDDEAVSFYDKDGNPISHEELMKREKPKPAEMTPVPHNPFLDELRILKTHEPPAEQPEPEKTSPPVAILGVRG